MRVPLIALGCAAYLLFAGTLWSAWQWSDPQPQGNGFAAAVRLPSGAFVAVGAYGAVARLVPGSLWSSTGPIAGSEDLTSLARDGGKLWASGPNAGLWQSLDEGVTWVSADPNFRARHLFWLSDRLVGLNGLRVSTTVGGSPAESLDLSTQGITSYRAAAAAAGRIIIVGDGGLVARSSDGSQWEITRPKGPDVIFYAAAAGESGFLLAGVKLAADGKSFQPVMVESADAYVWTDASPPAGAPFAYALLPAPGGWFYQNSGDGRLFRRVGNAQWSPVTGDLGPFAAAAAVRSSDLTDGALIFDSRGLIASVDASAASLVHTPLRPDGVIFAPRFAAAATGSLAVALDRNTRRTRENVVLRTGDGIGWSELSPPPVTSLSALFASADSIVGYTSGDTNTASGFFRTFDGSAWSRIAQTADPETGGETFSGPVVSMAANSDQSVILALARRDVYDIGSRYTGSRSLYRSGDWVSWTPVALPEIRDKPPLFEEVAESVQWDGGKFILLLNPGRIFTSPDGVTWTQLPPLPDDSTSFRKAYGSPLPPAANTAVSVASDGSVIVARAAKLAPDGKSYLARSAGGQEILYTFREGRWQPHSIVSAALPAQRRVIWDGAQFVAYGGRRIFTSADGVSWRSQASPADLVSLVWSGEKFFGFTDSFGLVSHAGRLSGGETASVFGVAPASKSLDAGGGAYSLEIAVPPGKDWKIEDKPSWLTAAPLQGTGPATVSLTVSPNAKTSARGAVLSIGGVFHYLHQSGQSVPAQLRAASLGSTVSIPFAGQWQLSGDPRLSVVSRTSGSGKISVRIPANPSSAARTVTVDVNGVAYDIVQDGMPLAVSREGSYEGLIGFLPDGLSPEPRNFQTYDGTIRIQITRPREEAGPRAFTARIGLHDGQRAYTFAGAGTIDEQGRLIGGPWKSSGAAPREIVLDDLRVTSPAGWSPRISGVVKFSDKPADLYSVVAAKQLFHSKSNPLPSEHTGRFTAFLGPFDSADVSAGLGAGTASLTTAGVARLAATLADGTKVTASAAVWGGFGPDLVVPYGFSLPGGRSLVAGFFTADATYDQSDWQGLGAWNNFPAGSVSYIANHLCRYTAPPFAWVGTGAFALSAESDAFSGSARLRRSGLIAVTPEVAEDQRRPSVSLQFNARTGMVSGSARRPGLPALRLVGAINPKAYALHGDRGAVSGVAIGPGRGSFTVVPVAGEPIVQP